MSADESYVLRIDTAEFSTDRDIQEQLDNKLSHIDDEGRRVRNTTCVVYQVGARTYLLYTFITQSK